MPADEVVVRSLDAGRAQVLVDGWQVPGVRSVQVLKSVNNRDVVTIELWVQRVTMLPPEPPPAERREAPPGWLARRQDYAAGGPVEGPRADPGRC